MPNLPAISDCNAQQARWPMLFGVGCAVSGVVLLAWQSAVQGDFHFDDYGNIVENRAIRSIWPLDALTGYGRPLGLYSFALNFHFSELNSSAYRLTNVLIHVANVLLMFAGVHLTGRIFSRVSPLTQASASANIFLAATIALIWGLHPLTTQAVTNIVQRYESLATMGYLGAWVGMLLVMEGGRRESAGWRWVGLAMILLSSWIGLLTKEIFATAPLVILLFDRLLTGQPWRTVLRTRWPAYVLLVSPFVWFIPSVARWFDPSRSSSMGFGLKSVSAWEYLRTQPEIIFHYLRLSVWPDPLCFDYAWRVQQNPVVYFFLGAIILVMLTTGFWLYLSGTSRQFDAATTTRRSVGRGIAGWLILAFFLILAPTSSVVPIADLCVEHRMYLPLAMVVSGVCLLGNRVRIALDANAQRPGVVRVGIVLSLLASLILLGWRTDLRNREYRDGITLWNTVLEVRPENPRAWFMLGSEYFGRNRFEDALPLYENAVSYQMPIGEFHAGLADCLREMGRSEDALKQYQRAIELKPTLAKAHNGLGVLQYRLGNLEAARDAFQEAHELGLPEARYNLPSVLIDLGELARAVPLLEASLAEHPDFSLPARRLAWILATAPQKELRDGGRAGDLLNSHFQIAESESPYVWDTHAAVLAEQQMFDDAVRAGERALELAENRDDSELITAIQERLECYHQQRPWRNSLEPQDRRREGRSHE